MYSFQANVGNRSYHVYKDTEWKPVQINQLLFRKNLMQHRCNIDKIGLATVVHIPCELSKFVFFSLQDGTVSGTIVDTKHKVSSIPEGGLEILCLLNFTHPCKEILDRMKEFVKKQLPRCKKSFKFDHTRSGSNNEERILAELDQDDEEKTRESNQPPEHSSKKNCKYNKKEKKRNNHSFLLINLFTCYSLNVFVNFKFFVFFLSTRS